MAAARESLWNDRADRGNRTTPPEPEKGSLLEYREGDVIVGVFACLIPQKRRTIRVRVTGRYVDKGRAGFIGEQIDHDHDEGYGAWGWDDEIQEVERG